MVKVLRLGLPAAISHIRALAEVLVDCVAGGASVSFMQPFTQTDAEAFFRRVIAGVESGDRILLAAFDGDRLVGTVQLLTNMPPNQPHRAEIAKLLVHRGARGQGVGQLLMLEVERQAQEAGKTLLVLDTVTEGAGERLYTRLGWIKVGIIPNYALFPDGTWAATTIFFKSLQRQ